LVSGHFRPGKRRESLVNGAHPQYPIAARNQGISGVVRLHVIIAKDGSVKMMEVVSGHPLLVQAALDAVGHWR
jgi:protein TonB